MHFYYMCIYIRSVMPCLCGCPDCIGKFSHYVMCPSLFEIIIIIIILIIIIIELCPSSLACPVERLGLINTMRESLLLVVCTFAGYHATKRHFAKFMMHPNFTNFSVGLNDGQKFFAVQVFAEAFWAETIDCKFKCRHCIHGLIGPAVQFPGV